MAALFCATAGPCTSTSLSGFGADFYDLDTVGRWQPDIGEPWIARITPADNLRDVRSHDHAEQPFQDGLIRHMEIRNAAAPPAG